MKRKRLALLLAAAMTVTSLDSTAMFVSGADFSSEVEEEVSTQAEEGAEVTEDTSADVDFSDEETAETNDAADVEVTEEPAQEEEVPVEEDADEADFSSDVQEEVAVDAGGSVIPDNVSQLEPGKDMQVELGEDADGWMSFKPTESGRYVFSSVSTGMDDVDPMAYLYNRTDIESLDDCWQSDDDSYGSDFALTAWLDAGTTYYYRVRNYRTSQCSFTVRLEKELEIESVDFDLSKMKSEFVAGMERCSAKGAEVTVKYKGESGQHVFTFGDEYYVSDGKGNFFQYDVRQGDTGYSPASYLPAGKYEFIFRSNGEEIKRTTITMKGVDASQFTNLNIGKNTVEVTKESEMHWYYFEAKEEGTYRFSFSTPDDDKDYDVSHNWREIDQDGNLSYNSPEWSEDGTGYLMGAGDRYLVGWYDYETSNVPYNATVTVAKVPKVKSVQVTADVKAEYTEYLEYVNPENIQTVVTYEDGTTKTLKGDEEDDYGRYLEYGLYKDGNYYGEYPQAGEYVFKFSFGGVAANEIPVKVVPMESKITESITDGESELTNDGKILLKYTASENGRYQFDFNVSVSKVEILKADGSSADNVGSTDNDSESYSRVFADLEKGTTYYVYAVPDEFCKKLTVNVTLVTRPVSLTAKSLKKDAYIAGIDSFRPEDIETTVSYGDVNRTVKGNGTIEGYYLNYQCQNEATGETIKEFNEIPKGTWTVTPYLTTVQSGSAIGIETTVPATVTSRMFDESELNALPKLEVNKWNAVENTRGERKFYTFKAGATGLYSYTWEDNKDYTVMFYKASDNGYDTIAEYASEKSQIRLEKDQTYLVAIYTSGTAKLNITQVNAGQKPETVKTIALTDGMEKVVSIDETTGNITCTFTPAADGYYTLKSEVYDGVETDTYAELYQGGTKIASNDDGNDNLQFRLSAKLSAGKEYTYKVRLYSESNNNVPFILKFNKTDFETIKDVEVVLKNGKNADDFDVFEDVDDFYQLKVTYENGQTALLDMNAGYYWSNSVKDSYGNYIEVRQSKDGSYADNSLKIKLLISCNISGQIKNITKEVTCKGIGILPAIEANKDYKIPSTVARYKFIPNETGEYIYSISDKADNGYLNVYKADSWYMYDGVDGSNYEGYKNQSVKLEKGKVYYIVTGSYQNQATDGTFRIQKVTDKTLTGLKLKNKPEKTTILPGNENAISYRGLQVEASYADGSKETITYGEHDSMGRYLHTKEVVWQANGKAKVYVALGRYTVNFELETGSWDTVEEIGLDSAKTLNIKKADTATLKFVPKEDGVYYIYVTNGTLYETILEESAAYNRYYDEGCYLYAGKTYYMNVEAKADNPTVTVKAECKNDKHSFGAWNTVKAATCVSTGLRNHTCTVCGKYEEETIPATGRHNMGSWKVTSEATVSREGSQERSCTVCGKKETAKIAKLTPTVKLNVTIGKTLPLKVKQSFQVKASGLAKGDKVASWKSSSTKIATVSKTGKIVGKKAGTATITVKLASGKSVWFKVKVQKSTVATTSLKVVNKATGKTIKSATLKAKKKLTLVTTIAPVTSKQKVTYSSSNKKIATVSSKGVITAKKKGTVTITVRSGKKSVKIKIKVTK